MKGAQYLYKVFSYIFIIFIIALITFTFGMPDFISSGADSNRYLAAKIGDEFLTKLQLNRTKENFIRQRFPGESLPENFRKNIEDQVFSQMIKSKVSLILIRNIGLYPIGRSKQRIMADYLKENYATYFSETNQAFEEFEKVLQANQLSYSELESEVLNDYANRNVFELLDSIQVFSNPEKVLLWDAKQIKINYEIGVIDEKKKKAILKKRATFTESDIQEKFKTDYLSKDKHATLTLAKRQAIEDSLYNKESTELENELQNEIEDSLKIRSLRNVALKYGIKVYSIKNVSIADNLDSKKVADMPSLANLDKSIDLQNFLTFAKENQGSLIFENKIFYLIAITKRKIPLAEVRKGALEKTNSLNQFLEKNKKDILEHSNKISGRYKTPITESIIETEKSKIKIKRFL